MNPPNEWRWFGHPGHLIVARDCRFHMRTEVGDWLISTVGEYVPTESVREIFAKSRGVALEGRGDAREADYMKKIGYEEVGYQRKYETMVFPLSHEKCLDPECMCGERTPASWSEEACRGYNLRGDAMRGHLEFCEEYARKDPVTA